MSERPRPCDVELLASAREMRGKLSRVDAASVLGVTPNRLSVALSRCGMRWPRVRTMSKAEMRGRILELELRVEELERDLAKVAR